ncbi:hypothetical protein IIA16_06650 [bacterium]|nr:hypothetical protein [bacterium]
MSLLLGIVLPWRGTAWAPAAATEHGLPWQPITIGQFRRALAAMLVFSFKEGSVTRSRLHALAQSTVAGNWYNPFRFKSSNAEPFSPELEEAVYGLVTSEVLMVDDRPDPVISVVDHVAAHGATMLVNRVSLAPSYWAAKSIGLSDSRLASRIMCSTTAYHPRKHSRFAVGPGIAHGVPEVGVDVRHGLTGEDILEIAARLSMPFDDFEAHIVAANAPTSTPTP